MRRKLKASELPSWSISPEELLHRLDDAGPLTFIFNAVAWIVNPAFAKNHFGYASEDIIYIIFYWYRAVTQCTHIANGLTAKLRIKIS